MDNNKDKIDEVIKLNKMNDEYNDVTFEKEVPFQFDEEESEEETEAVASEEKDEPVRKSAKKVDISKLTIIDNRDPIATQREIKNALYGNKSAFQIVAAQSGYVANIAPLVHKDVVNLLYSNLGRYEYKKQLYRVIFEKITSFSVGQMTYDEWLKSTSVEDLETFFYGLYCSTFPDEGTLSITCPTCGNEETVKISNVNLAKTTDRKAMKKLIEEVSSQSNTKDIMHKFSLIGKTEAFALTDSGIVIELRTPTLWDSLELLRLVPENVIDKNVNSLTNMLYINRMLIPKKGANQYVEETDRQELLRIVDNLTLDDAREVQDAVSKRVDDHRISYSVKNYKCQHCKTNIKDIPISIEEILFTLIYDKIQ